MERCTLTLAIPSPEPSSDTKKKATLSDNTSINIWRVKASSNINARALSWSNRPARESLVATIQVMPGQDMGSPEFHCPSGSLQSFEISCATEDCHLQFQQDMKGPRLGKDPAIVCIKLI
jgi:hypothetical protein